MSNMRALATDFVDNSSIEKTVLTGIGITVIILLIIVIPRPDALHPDLSL